MVEPSRVLKESGTIGSKTRTSCSPVPSRVICLIIILSVLFWTLQRRNICEYCSHLLLTSHSFCYFYPLHYKSPFFFLLTSIQIMAILDHFGYSTHPMEDYDDPLWHNRDDFKPWLKHIEDSKRLIIIDDSAASPKSSKPDVIHKKLQVTSDKIKAKVEERLGLGVIKPSQIQWRVNPLSQRKEMVELKRNPKGGPKRPELLTALPGPVQLERKLPDLLLEGRVPVYFQSKAPNPKGVL